MNPGLDEMGEAREASPHIAELERVYRDVGPKLWRSLYAASGDREVADEALAETFAQALRRGDELRSPEDWVWVAAFRVARGLMKARSTHPAPSGLQLVPGTANDDPPLADDIVRALLALPAQQRLAVVLHDYADRPMAEVTSALAVTRATAYVHLSRARRRLRELLEGTER